MTPQRWHRVRIIIFVLGGFGLAVGLVLAALRQNVQHFYSPTDIHEGKAPQGRTFRLGGLVLENSVQRVADGLQVHFMVTDRFQQQSVIYSGILPDLFREGQSVVATGALDAQGEFVAAEVLAKHDETYMPAEVADAIARAKKKTQ